MHPSCADQALVDGFRPAAIVMFVVLPFLMACEEEPSDIPQAATEEQAAEASREKPPTEKSTRAGSPSPAKEAAEASAGEPSAETGLTGAVTEEVFKSLHTLRGDKAPPLQGSMVRVGEMEAYLSLPDREPPVPALLVIHEWWGLNEHIKHWADRLAADGYAALAVDLYGGESASTRDEAMALMKKVSGKEAVASLEKAHAFLLDHPKVRAQRTGSIGWCFGGGYSLKAALNIAELDAAVIYYGHLETDPAKLRAIEAPLLGIFGHRDEGIPPSAVDAFDEALDEADVQHRILRYDAEHAFANPSSDRYDQEAAREAFREVRSFLAAHLAPKQPTAPDRTPN